MSSSILGEWREAPGGGLALTTPTGTVDGLASALLGGVVFGAKVVENEVAVTGALDLIRVLWKQSPPSHHIVLPTTYVL